MSNEKETNGTPQAQEYVISKKMDLFFSRLYTVYKFNARFFRESIMPPYEWKEILRQCYEVGVRSLPLVSITGFITGIVFTNQSRPSLEDFGATSWLPSLISIAVVRALAPLVTALIAAGRVGSAIGAEISSMRVSEQIDAMEVSATNPYKYLVASRVLATTIMVPGLMMYMGFVAYMGSFMNIYQHEQTSFTIFINDAFSSISFLDLYSSLAKSIVFGYTIGMVGCYKGWYATNGTQGVGMAANSAVVTGMFLIFVEELFAMLIINAIRG
ncbi:MAG: ABC transporter permease [Bacteroidota bacterium]|nr:ABC transporter permease [Bacteroidota bacterium]